MSVIGATRWRRCAPSLDLPASRVPASEFVFGVAVAVLGLAAVGGCGKQEATTPASTTPTAAAKPAPQRPPAKPANAAAPRSPARASPVKANTPAKGRLFVDISGSMRGFVEAEGGTMRIESLHRLIGEAFGRHGVTGVQVCEIGAKAAPTCGLKTDPKRYGSANKRKRRGQVLTPYRAKESRLAAALAPIRRDAQLTDKGEMPVTPLEGADVVVVVTDGIESHSRTTGSSGDASAVVPGCQDGADVHCLQRVLVHRARQGWGVFLLPVSLPFQGRVFAERGMDEAMYQQVVKHVTTLRTDPEWAASNPRVGSFSPKTRSGNANYRYSGPRPLLLMILARKGHHRVGRRLAKSLGKATIAAKLPTPALRLGLLDAAPRSTLETWRFAPELGIEKRPAAAVAHTYPASRGKDGVLRYSLECDRAAALGLTVTAERTESLSPSLEGALSGRALARFVKARPLQAAGALSKLTERRVDASSGSWQAALQCLHLTEGKTSRVRAKLWVKRKYRKNVAGMWWWKRFHATTTWRRPERMYLFGELAEALVAELAREPRLVDEAEFTIKRI